MRIFVSVPEALSEQIKTGMHVSVQLTELPNQTFDGQVTRNDHSIDPATRSLLVEVDVPNPGGNFLPEAYGQVHFKLSTPTRPLIVPYGRILFQSAGPQVAVVTAQNTIELRKVVIGRDFGNIIEITNGINLKDSVVASPPDYLVNDMHVSVQSQTAAQPPASKRS